jgi:hypothetical protein
MTEQAQPRIAARVGLRLAAILGVIALLLAPLLLRTLVDGRAELVRAEAAAEAGDVDAEIRHLGRAARFHLPLASHDELALDRLQELARSAESAGEIVTALAAWRELRSALISTRTIDVRRPERLHEANAAIVELMVAEARASGRPSARDRWAEELEQDLEPRGRSLLAALCFAAWLVSCVGFFARGVDAKGRLIPRPALRWGGSALLLLILWILLM